MKIRRRNKEISKQVHQECVDGRAYLKWDHISFWEFESDSEFKGKTLRGNRTHIEKLLLAYNVWAYREGQTTRWYYP